MFNKKQIALAEEIVQNRKICNNCLGRQFAQVSTGLTNQERGKKLRKLLKKKQPSKCDICNDLFKNLDKYAEKIANKLKGIEFSTFIVGSKLNYDLSKKEESLWEEFPIDAQESIRSEINRELGKLIYKKTKKEMDRKIPDINILLNLVSGETEIKIRSLYLYGGYKKLIRGIPQTKWDKYKESVEDIIAKPVMKATRGEAHSLHGCGREDIDALCLDYRPFVLEIKSPKKRKLPLKKLVKEINKTKKVEISGLETTDRNKVKEIKTARLDKVYRVLVEFKKIIKDIDKLKDLKGIISQKTPKRVSHRRAILTRKRKVKALSWKQIDKKTIEMKIKCEAGLYIKELVSGDNGNSKPSVSEILKNPAKVKQLDVIKIEKSI